jgi:hypothetical protein
VDRGVKPTVSNFAGGTLLCQCPDNKMAMTIKGQCAHNHVCGCTKCWEPKGALFSQVAVVPRANLSVAANGDKLKVMAPKAPDLTPIADQARIDPVHFAIIFIFLVGDAIGFITPSHGLNLYAASGVIGIPYFRLSEYTTPYLATLLAWTIIVLVPQLSTMLLFHQGAGVFAVQPR